MPQRAGPQLLVFARNPHSLPLHDGNVPTGVFPLVSSRTEPAPLDIEITQVLQRTQPINQINSVRLAHTHAEREYFMGDLFTNPWLPMETEEQLPRSGMSATRECPVTTQETQPLGHSLVKLLVQATRQNCPQPRQCMRGRSQRIIVTTLSVLCARKVCAHN